MRTKHAGILAAGVGSRLGTLAEDKPKCLLKVAGKPILQHQLEALTAAGIDDVTVVAGYRASDVIDWLSANPGFRPRVIVNEEYEFTSNMYSALLLREYLDGYPFLLCNGDVVYAPEIIERMASQSDDAIAVDVGSFDDESMKVTVDDNGAITTISKTTRPGESYGRSQDLYALQPQTGAQFFNECDRIITEESRNLWTEVALQVCFDSGLMRPRPIDSFGAPWVEIDTEDDLLRADRAFSDLDLSFYQQFFVDLDGTLVLDGQLLPGAAGVIEQLRFAGSSFHIVSNNSSLSSAGYATKLSALGIDVRPDEIVLSTDGLASHLRELNVSKVFCLGTESMREHLRRYDIRHVESNPEYVVVGYDTELTYEKLANACLWINRGTPYLASHPDIACPTARGPIPDIGSLTKMIEMTTGATPKRVFGKPDPAMLEHLIKDPARSVMIGDRLYTDMLIARECGIDFICVLSGETSRRDVEDLVEDDWPQLVVSSVATLLE